MQRASAKPDFLSWRYMSGNRECAHDVSVLLLNQSGESFARSLRKTLRGCLVFLGQDLELAQGGCLLIVQRAEEKISRRALTDYDRPHRLHRSVGRVVALLFAGIREYQQTASG